ncbi:MAG TPA: hypothetical protein VHK01_19655 [Lacipirellulaceae bacterium]|nr:hypothetical protein [Lacipirellulaceae bacterium]
MIKRYNNLSFVFFIPGIILQIIGYVMSENSAEQNPLAVALLLVGTILAIIGFGYYAKAKGRSMAWGLAGFLGLIGLLILAVLKDRSGDPWNT